MITKDTGLNDLDDDRKMHVLSAAKMVTKDTGLNDQDDKRKMHVLDAAKTCCIKDVC